MDTAGSRTGWQGKAGEFGDRDLRLFDAIVATMTRSYAVDKHRIYVTGFSNGAVFSLLLWAERAKTIAAIGEVAGRLEPSETLTFPRALLAVAGRSDTVAPFAVQKRTIQQARQIDRASGAGRPMRPVLQALSVNAWPGPGQDVHPPGRARVPQLGADRDRQVLQIHNQRYRTRQVTVREAVAASASGGTGRGRPSRRRQL